jgi:large subunit ribosomal protein L6
MSRIGKHPVTVPQGVNVTVDGNMIRATGKLGELKAQLPPGVVVTFEDGKIGVMPREDADQGRAQWGLSRTLVQNMITGVAQGFTRRLEISGVGYRAAIDGKVLNLQLGYSHDIKFAVPEDVKIACETPTAINISGADRQRVGQIAAEIRSFRKPEPYKGKGIRYSDEKILRKEGKKK